MKCLNKLTEGLSLMELQFLKENCHWKGIRNECCECAFYPENPLRDSACELIKDSQKNRKIPIPDGWQNTSKSIEFKEFSPLPPEIVLKKMRGILDNCPKDCYDRIRYISEEDCKNCPLFHIACYYK